MDYHCLIDDNARREPSIMSQWFDVALHNINQGVCFFDNNRRLILANRRYAEIYDLPMESIHPGMTFAEIVELRTAAGSGPETKEDIYRRWADVIRVGDKPADTVVALKNGKVIAIHLRIMPDRGWVATHEDITERQQAQFRLSHMARHDPLTGLPNRALLREFMEQDSVRRVRDQQLAVLCLDLDGFKRVNDEFGHATGDALLCAVAERLRASVRQSDVVVRLGGDEFAVIQIGATQPKTAATLAQRLIHEIARPYRLGTDVVTVGTSIGIAWAAHPDDEAGELLKAADQALYRAKAAGRGTYRIFEPSMDAEARQRRQLESELRKAQVSQEFALFFQPIVDARTHRLNGFEALVRWHHPTRGLLPASEFISCCEDIDIIVPLGEWVLQEACRTAAQWPGELYVAVNLSTVQFRGSRLVTATRQALAASGLPSHRLELEITETVLLRQTPATTAMLHELRSLGARVALDDFGTGYSSISYLRGFPFDKLKIDATFIRDLGQRPNARAIVHAIVELARVLDISCTAEGVETAEQSDACLAEGCSELQGFLFSPARPAGELADLIARQTDLWPHLPQSEQQV